MSDGLWIVPSRAREVSLDGVVGGLRASLSPGSHTELALGGAVVWLDWETHPPHEHGWRADEWGRGVEHGAIRVAYRLPAWSELFRVVERLATATRGSVYLDGALPWTAEELGGSGDLERALAEGLPWDRWPALARELLDAVEARSGTGSSTPGR